MKRVQLGAYDLAGLVRWQGWQTGIGTPGAGTLALRWHPDGTFSDPRPLAGATLTSGTVYIDADDGGVEPDYCAWYVDGELWRDNDIDPPWQLRQAGMALSPGPHTVTVVGFYPDGSATTEAATFTIDTLGPLGFAGPSTTGHEVQWSNPYTTHNGNWTTSTHGPVPAGTIITGRLTIDTYDELVDHVWAKKGVRVSSSRSTGPHRRPIFTFCTIVTLVELNDHNAQDYYHGVAFGGATLIRCKIGGFVDGIKLASNMPVLAEDCYFYAPCHKAEDAGQSMEDSHNDAMLQTLGGGAGTILRRCRVDGFGWGSFDGTGFNENDKNYRAPYITSAVMIRPQWNELQLPADYLWEECMFDGHMIRLFYATHQNGRLAQRLRVRDCQVNTRAVREQLVSVNSLSGYDDPFIEWSMVDQNGADISYSKAKSHRWGG